MEATLTDNLNKIKNLVLDNNDFTILSHMDPDGDAVGGVCALAHGLKKIGKNVRPVLSGSLPINFYYLPLPVFEKKIPDTTDIFFVLDCAALDRTGYMQEVLKREKVQIINIDHHIQLNDFGHINVVDPSLTSTSEIIFHLLDFLSIDVDKNMANCLLTGIYFDTGSFMHSNTTKDSLEIAAQLVSKGANIKQIAENNFRRKNVSALKLWGRVLSRIKNDREKGIVSSIITKKDLEECGANESDIEGVVNLINSIPDARAALLLREDKDEIRGSLRSENGGLDVRKVANLFGGGGHVRASGFRIKGKLRETENGWEIIEE